MGELWCEAVAVCCGCSVAVAVWGGWGDGKMQCGDVAVGGAKVWGGCSVEEQCCGELQYTGVAVWGVLVWGDVL